MRTLPIIRSEFKRSAWVLLAALAVIIPSCVGMAANDICSCAHYAAMYIDTELDISASVINSLCTFSVIWAALLVYVQYINDRPDFARALPYTSKQLVLGKSVTAVFVSAVVSIVYAVFMIVLANRYAWLTKTACWTSAPIYEDKFDVNFVLISAFAAFLLSLAVYWYISLCCCVGRNVFAGFGLAFLGFSAFSGCMSFSNDIEGKDIVNILRDLFKVFGLENYTISLIIVLFALVLLLLTVPAALKLYGGGNAVHPIFRYAGAAKTAGLFFVLTFAFYAPEITDIHDNLPLAFTIGGAVGLAIAAAANKFILKRCGK